jgi:tRNA(fMet)-specific endonuclease VapC
MAERILLDTSMLIDIFDKNGDKSLLESECYLSVISIYEYVRYKRYTEEQKLLLEGAFETVNFSNPIILKASEIFAKLKKAGKLVNENDIYIAASAIANNLKLYTKDHDFKEIKNLFPELQVTLI